MKPVLQILHLPNRLDRQQSFLEEMNLQRIRFNLWAGITSNKRPCTNISQAHKQIVRHAKDMGWPYVVIMEDDCKFSCAGAWNYFLSKMPEDFDLYCGLMLDGKTDGNGRIITENGMSGTNTLYMVHERFYDFFLMVDESHHLDRELGKFATLNKYILCEPMVCYQMGGYSDNFKRKLTYEAYMSEIKLYGQ